MPMSHLIAGAMSGTSADGVDIALTRIGGDWPQPVVQLLHHHHRPYDLRLRQRIFAVRGEGAVGLGELAELGRQVSLVYAAAVNEALCAAHLSAGAISAVAAHGQTLFHAPPNTMQWLDPALIAAETGCAVVSDFRRADCAAGGQGAPLVPFADYVLFRHAAKSRVLLNLGGIANLTYLPAGCGLEQVVAFDTGPANCVSDYLCRRHDPSGPGYDLEGRQASAGRAHFPTAQVAARCAYVFARPPKSTDGPAMIAMFEQACQACGFDGSLEDQLATACLVTALSLQMAFDLFLPGWRDGRVQELIVTGGGTGNACLMGLLRQYLAEAAPTMALMQPEPVFSQAKEALAFALLGTATLEGVPSNVPGATGARHPVVLGSVTPRPRS